MAHVKLLIIACFDWKNINMTCIILSKGKNVPNDRNKHKEHEVPFCGG